MTLFSEDDYYGTPSDVEHLIQQKCLESRWVEPGYIPAAGEVVVDDGTIRTFDTGATRDTNGDKFDYEGFLHPKVLEGFAAYMHANRRQSDGSLRDSDNWQKGMPTDVYMKSAWRHFHEWWSNHRSPDPHYVPLAPLYALMFNVMGYIYEELRKRGEL